MEQLLANDGYFLLRVPTRSLSFLKKLNSQTLIDDQWKFISETLKDPEILDAIYLASLDCYEQILRQLKNLDQDTVDRDLLYTVFKYLNRMSSRPTPFGKFSGIGYGEVVDKPSAIVLTGETRSVFRIAMETRSKLIEERRGDLEHKLNMICIPNTTIFEQNGKHFYIDFDTFGIKRRFHWTRLNMNPLMRYVFTISQGGQRFEALVNELTGKGLQSCQATAYIETLINNNVLVSNQYPLGEEDLGNEKDVLSNLGLDCRRSPTINKLKELVGSLNHSRSKKYAFNLIGESSGLNGNSFCVETEVETHRCQINRSQVDKIKNSLIDLLPLTQSDRPAELIQFCRTFTNRYGDQEVALLEVLNPEIGIGYGDTKFNDQNSPLLRSWPERKHTARKASNRPSCFKMVLDGIYNRAKDVSHISLNKEEIKEIGRTVTSSDIPLGCYAIGNILAGNGSQREDLIFGLHAFGGCSSVNLLTRFSHLDKRVGSDLKKSARREEAMVDEGIIAEIAFLPDTRSGNILDRPSLYKYQIPIIGESGWVSPHTIRLDDLWVSVKNGEVILQSRRLNKRIFPRLSSAHNFHYGMDIYRFMCDLQLQSNSFRFNWDWGELEDVDFLPRVSYSNIILVRARWRLRKVCSKASDDLSYVEEINALREKYNLPRNVCFSQGDNELVIDFFNQTACCILLKELNKRDIIVKEYLYDDFQSPVIGAQNERYANEVVIPLIGQPINIPKVTRSADQPNVKRRFSPGTEWLYLKIYCAETIQDQLLTAQIKPLIETLLEKNIIDNWFFIRYRDPESHLRLRIRITSPFISNAVASVIDEINRFFMEAIEDKTVRKLVYDTYERELERYGAANVENCETIFRIDSETFLKTVPFFRSSENARWLIAALEVDQLICSFNLRLKQRLNLATRLRDAFFDEFDEFSGLKRNLDQKYRTYRQLLDSCFSNIESENSPIQMILNARGKQLYQVINAWNVSTANLESVISSLAHMTVNRVFPDRQREHEMIIYHFLSKHYTTQLKRVAVS
ncbi:MAG: lantibiotic dehydratase [Sphingobacterium sp.]